MVITDGSVATYVYNCDSYSLFIELVQKNDY